MDTEEHIQIKQATRNGYPYTDEGPYYHHAWWESYKGGIKGKLGGLTIGALIGAAAGAIAVSMLAVAVPALGTAAIMGVIGGFAAGGMLFGAHEFSDIGHISGAVAAGEDLHEKRMRTYENGKFAEIKNEIAELKALVTGKPAATTASADNAASIEKSKLLEGYRTTHYTKDGKDELPKRNRYVFWRIAAIGLVVGLAAGALLAFGGLSAPLIEGLGSAFGASASGVLAKTLASTVGKYLISMTAMGAIGASFGINRDIFRKIFDKTDLWFKGIIGKAHSNSPEMVVTPSGVPEPVKSASVSAQAAPPSYEGAIDYPKSDTHFRDRVLTAAERALLSFDHTHATPQ